MKSSTIATALPVAKDTAQAGSPDPKLFARAGEFDSRERRRSKQLLQNIRLVATVLAVALMLAGASPNLAALAQTASPSTSVVLSESTVKALQEALTKQGIAVKADGVLNDETRAAVRKYQSQHHLPVTGEPDRATLAKLGVAGGQTAAPTQGAAIAQVTPTTPPAGSPPAQAQAPTLPSMPGGMMMNCPMMQGMAQGQMMQGQMMQMMQGMMQMMQMMQTQMQMMQGQMQPGSMQPGQTQPGQTAPGQTPGPMQPGQMQPGGR